MSGNLYKVAGCRVKPYELIQRKDEDMKVEGDSVETEVEEQDMVNSIDEEVESKLPDGIDLSQMGEDGEREI